MAVPQLGGQHHGSAIATRLTRRALRRLRVREDADGNDADGELESGSSISNSSLTHSYPSKNWSQSSGVTEGFNAGTDTGSCLQLPGNEPADSHIPQLPVWPKQQQQQQQHNLSTQGMQQRQQQTHTPSHRSSLQHSAGHSAFGEEQTQTSLERQDSPAGPLPQSWWQSTGQSQTDLQGAIPFNGFQSSSHSSSPRQRGLQTAWKSLTRTPAPALLHSRTNSTLTSQSSYRFSSLDEVSVHVPAEPARLSHPLHPARARSNSGLQLTLPHPATQDFTFASTSSTPLSSFRRSTNRSRITSSPRGSVPESTNDSSGPIHTVVWRTHPAYTLQASSSRNPTVPATSASIPRSRLSTLITKISSLLGRHRTRSSSSSSSSSMRHRISGWSVASSLSEASLSPCGSERWPGTVISGLALIAAANSSVQAPPEAPQSSMAHLTSRFSQEWDSHAPAHQPAGPRPSSSDITISSGVGYDPRKRNRPASRLSEESRTSRSSSSHNCAMAGHAGSGSVTLAPASLAASSLLYQTAPAPAAAAVGHNLTAVAAPWDGHSQACGSEAAGSPSASLYHSVSFRRTASVPPAATACPFRISEEQGISRGAVPPLLLTSPPSKLLTHDSIYGQSLHVGGALEMVCEGPAYFRTSPSLRPPTVSPEQSPRAAAFRPPVVPTGQIRPSPLSLAPSTVQGDAPPRAAKPPTWWRKFMSRFGADVSARSSTNASASASRRGGSGSLHALPRGSTLEDLEAIRNTHRVSVTARYSEGNWSLPGGRNTVTWSSIGGSSTGGDVGFAQEAMQGYGSMPWCVSSSTQLALLPPPP
ncbi:MAG: hypothetical protein WDW38_009618 [Sanguina aurantia]